MNILAKYNAYMNSGGNLPLKSFSISCKKKIYRRVFTADRPLLAEVYREIWKRTLQSFYFLISKKKICLSLAG